MHLIVGSGSPPNLSLAINLHLKSNNEINQISLLFYKAIYFQLNANIPRSWPQMNSLQFQIKFFIIPSMWGSAGSLECSFSQGIMLMKIRAITSFLMQSRRNTFVTLVLQRLPINELNSNKKNIQLNLNSNKRFMEIYWNNRNDAITRWAVWSWGRIEYHEVCHWFVIGGRQSDINRIKNTYVAFGNDRIG